MKFLHLTDLHYLNTYPVEEEGYLAVFKEMTNPIIQLKKGLEQIDLDEIEAVVITGDLVECGDEADYQSLKNHLEDIFGEIPLIITLGNHDTRKAFYKGWLGQEGIEVPYHTVTRLKDVTFIGFDVSDEKEQTGLMTTGHYDWLEKALKEAEGTDIILLLHHHLLEEQTTMPPMKYDERFYEIIEKSRICGILGGHTHYAYTGKFAGKDYMTAQGLSFSAVDIGERVVRFEEYSGFNCYTLENQKLTSHHIQAITDKRLLVNVNFNNA